MVIGLVWLAGRLLQTRYPGDAKAIQSTGISIASWGFLLIAILLIITLATAWTTGWPRWSFPYLGIQLALSLLLTGSTFPGLRLFGHTFTSDEFLGWRAWIPEMIWLAIGLILTRSLKPAGQLFKGIGQDWTRLSFLIYGLLPVVMVITFDEVRAEEWILVLLGLFLAGGALGYLRAIGRMHSFVWLAGSVALVWTCAAVYLGVYWNERKEAWMTTPGNGWQVFFQTLLFGLVLVAILSLPGVVAGLAGRTKK